MSFPKSFGSSETDEDNVDEENNDFIGYFPKSKIPKLNSNEKIEQMAKGKEENKIKKENTMSTKANFARDYLLKLGYKEGHGLGKHQDGIVEPVEASKQKGRRGFGFKGSIIKDTDFQFDPNLEKISVVEEVLWLKNDHSNSLNRNQLEAWLKIGSAQKCIDSSSSFCETHIIENILLSKDVLNSISSKELKNSRSRSNPFESIQKAIFLNRAAMKMANLDALLENMFTQPTNSKGESIVGGNDLLYFADVCAGPGGFSEYILYRKKWHAKGFGFTLRNQNDFLLDEFCAGPSETFEPFYGKRGDGNIFFPENITSFRDHVLKYTDGKGVHFMMADGGVQIDENFNDQELICKKLYLCQCLMALHIVRTEGSFVVKLFDLFTSFSVGLIYLMYRSFKKITIVKPNTSRPANSERYLICKWKREDCLNISEHLFEVNLKVPEYHGKIVEDVLELVPTEILLKDDQFFQFIFSSNNKIGKNQIVALRKLFFFSTDEELKEERQQELRQKCLEKWDIPDVARAEPKKFDARNKCIELLGNVLPYDPTLSDKLNNVYSIGSLKKIVESVYSWNCIIINGEENCNSCTFYLGLGRNNIYRFTKHGQWLKWNENSIASGLCLPANTLLYGELVQECFGEGRGQRKAFTLHIIDALFLGGEDIRKLSFKERWDKCKLFAKSLFKENFPIRVKIYYSLANINSLMEQLLLKSIKSVSASCVCVPVEENIFWKASGIMFLKDTRELWNRFMSLKTGLMYLHNKKTDEKEFEEKIDISKKSYIYADFGESFRTKKIWWWDLGVVVHEGQSIIPDVNKMQKEDLLEFVKTNKK